MADKKFKLVSEFKPAGDQPRAIDEVVHGFKNGARDQVLLGATGTGKTFVMSNVIQELQKPTLILAHNKTLAAQLCSEFQEFFPENAVSYFVSYYDYYQPEAYMARTDTYIEKDASINDEINKYRHAATINLLTRKDVLIVSSVSCIYGLGSVEEYGSIRVDLEIGKNYKRDKILRHLIDIQYTRSQLEFRRGMFHVLGDTVEVYPPSGDTIYRLEFFGDELERISEADAFTGEELHELQKVSIFPAKHNVTRRETLDRAIPLIQKDLKERYDQLRKIGKNIEAERLKTRTEYDIEMLLETGYCNGIENYVRYLNFREAGDQPSTLIDYFPDDFLLIVDESHMTIPQLNAMYNGNLSRKQNLVEYGFRMPSALDNRPLKFEEFEEHMNQSLYVSATPGKYELAKTKGKFIEQIIRPTGLLDPMLEVRPTKGQIDDILKEINKRVDKKERVLLTTLTKRSAEELTDFLTEKGVRVRYLHSEIDTLERIEILRDLRLGKFDVLVGINLLREGLDLPEVSFIGILDADKQGFLRSRQALIQTIGRCARNAEGFVVMYGDKITDAMREAIDETLRRREIQIQYNKKHGITPKTIKKAVKNIEFHGKMADRVNDVKKIPKGEVEHLLKTLNAQMDLASQNLEFEKAAELRDEIDMLRSEFNL